MNEIMEVVQDINTDTESIKKIQTREREMEVKKLKKLKQKPQIKLH